MIATTAFCLVKRISRLVGRPFVGNPARRFQTFFRVRHAERGHRALQFMDLIHTTVAVGKYLISPLIRHTDNGDFAASVSIRSGRGSGTHDRVMRFTPRFASHAQAQHYATEQGLGWVRERTLSRVVAA
jgi:hypothetical protein